MRLDRSPTRRALVPPLVLARWGCGGRMTTITVPATAGAAGVSTATVDHFDVDRSGFPCRLNV